MKLKNPTTYHMERQAERRKAALAQAEHDAQHLGAKGQSLKTPRTGKALEKAIVENMKARGYALTARKFKIRPAGERKSREVIRVQWTRVPNA